MRRASRGVFVGRAEELEQLRMAWKSAASGTGSIIAISGEPGIGKTCLVETVAGVLGGASTVLRGAFIDEADAPPFLGWSEALQALVAATPRRDLAALLGAEGPVLAGFTRELRGTRKPAPQLESGQSGRFRLQRAVADVLERAALRRPILLLLDNLHWADAPSVEMLRFLAREVGRTRLLVVVTYQERLLASHHRLRRAVAEMAGLPAFQRIELKGFTVAEVSEYLVKAQGSPPRRKDAARLARRTGGNPFFVSEVVRLHGGTPPAGRLRVPLKVQDVIRGWIDAMSPDTRETLAAAAVLGEAFAGDAVQACRMPAAKTVLPALSEAAAAGLVVEQAGRAKGWRFAHSLVRECLLSGLSIAARTELHAHAGSRLARLYKGSIEEHACELAGHFYRAVGITGVHEYLRYCFIAGESAFRAHAYEAAEELYLRAQSTLPGSRSEIETAEIFFGLGRARAALNQPEQAARDFECAFEGFEKARGRSRAVAVAMHPFLVSFRGSGATLLCRRALPLVPAGSLDAGRLQCQLGVALAQEERNYPEARSAAAAALRLARRHADGRLETRALLLAAHISREELALDESLSLARKSLAAGARSPDPLFVAVGNHLAQEALLAAGELDQARIHGERCLRAAQAVRDRVWLGLAYASSERGLLARGDWDGARRFSDLGLGLDPANPFLLAHRARWEAELGQSASERYLDCFLEGLRRKDEPARALSVQYASLAGVLPLVHRIAKDDALLDAAETAARKVLAYALSTPEWRLRAAGCLGLVAAARGDARAAGESYRRLSDLVFRDGKPLLAFCRGTLTFLQWQLAVIARGCGDLARAEGHFRRALQDALRGPHEPELAWIRRDLAALILQGSEGDPDGEAARLLAASIETARRLGLGPLAVSVEALRQKAGESSPLAALTGREREVLKLVALGRTNKEIAAELFIAERTAGNHVSNLLAKIGCGNRVEAAALAHRHELEEREARP